MIEVLVDVGEMELYNEKYISETHSSQYPETHFAWNPQCPHLSNPHKISYQATCSHHILLKSRYETENKEQITHPTKTKSDINA